MAADSTTTTHPLLSEYSKTEDQNPDSASNPSEVDDDDEEEENHPIPIPVPSLDSAIERFIGDLGWPQIVQAVLVSLAWFFDAQQIFLSVFTDADPAWHCTDTPSASCSATTVDVCLLPRDAWTWDLPAHTSIVSEWGLQCAGSFVMGLPESSFFAGCLIGGILLATLADSSLGRKNMLFAGSILMSLIALTTSFSTDVWIYSALRFLCGFVRSTIGTSSLVLSTELVGKKYRPQVGIFGFLCFTLGFVSLPALALLNDGNTWRNLYLWTSIPSIIYSFVILLAVRESPRWLFVRGRRDEAIATLKSISIARSSSIMSFSRLPMMEEQETNSADLYSTIKIMTDKPWALRRLATAMLISFGSGLMYYGMPLSVGNLEFNLYLSTALNAVSEIPACLLSFFMVGTTNRKSGILTLMELSGICSIAAAVVGDMGISSWISMGLELLAFSMACAAFNVLMIYTLELFPTCVRNSAVSMVRQALVLGGVFSPMLAAAGRKGTLLLSYGVFGLSIAGFGLFILCLPETRGRPISDTMDEEEHRDSSDHDNNVLRV